MGKPRMIILVRHAQSEGNKNRDIHQFIPDHRVKLTAQGRLQAEEAGRQLRSLLKPDDTIQFFTSPYRRTRETTEGILRTLTGDDPTPSPFARHKIKVFEEPRLREQDFGNFQPCSAEMERMWQERADYGHFFYRIPNGESAADAYDRVSGFNESLWRQFGDEDFPSVCVLVTHGLMTRVFLMKWYHWSVEYFEDLRNVNHCEFIVMKQSSTSNKYILENELRTWSELKRRTAAAGTGPAAVTAPSPSKALPAPGSLASSPTIPARRWGGCVNGCEHDKVQFPRRVTRKSTMDLLGATSSTLPPSATPLESLEGEKEDHPIAAQDADHTPTIAEPSAPKTARKPSSQKSAPSSALSNTPASPNDASDNSSTSEEGDRTSGCEQTAPSTRPQPRTAAILRHLHRPGQLGPQGDGFSDDSDYFPGMQHAHAHQTNQHSSPPKNPPGTYGKLKARTSIKLKDRKSYRKTSEQSWMHESGMGTGARADALGDGDDVSEDIAYANRRCASPTRADEDEEEKEEPILREALKGDMTVAHHGEERAAPQEDSRVTGGERELTDDDVEKMKDAERKGFGEIY